MRIDVKNVGPIEAGRVDVAPLTVVIGPNNAGKSVLATLTYAATHARHSSGYVMTSGGGLVYRAPMAWLEMPLPPLNPNQIMSTLRTLIDGSPVTRKTLTPELGELLADRAKQTLATYGQSLRSEIERCFGAKLTELVRSGSPKAASSIRISSPSARWDVEVELGARARESTIGRLPDTLAIARNLQTLARKAERRNPRVSNTSYFLYQVFDQAVMSHIFRDFPNASFYLPAARSGILQSHRALASFVMTRAPLAGIEDMKIPRMSGVVTDFISQLLQMENRSRGPFHEVAAVLERRLLEGNVAISTTGPGTYPEISYRTGSGRMPLHRTSSMISELAPIVLYLRNLLDPGEFLIIEEPESHLHPHSQMVFAEVLLQLVRGGLQLMLTTHSDYFLSSLNAGIARSSLPDAGEAAVSADQVSAYLLARIGDSTRIRRLNVNPRTGIEEDEFSSVAEQMYDTVYTIDEEISGGSDQ